MIVFPPLDSCVSSPPVVSMSTKCTYISYKQVIYEKDSLQEVGWRGGWGIHDDVGFGFGRTTSLQNYSVIHTTDYGGGGHIGFDISTKRQN